MPRTFIITESQLKLIKEARSNNFDFDELTNIPSFSGKVKYCKQHLGQPVGRGTSRLVFQYTDYQVLKLAMNAKGVAQNEYEGRSDWFKEKYSIFPKVYSKAENNSWLLSEYVLPAANKDFQHCLGLSFKEWCNVVIAIESQLRPNSYNKFYRSKTTEQMLTELVDENEFIGEFYDYFANYNETLGDMRHIQNYGLALRNGKPWLVILDSGLSDDIFNNYYRR